MPKEIHEHFDAHDNYTGKTVVTRESEWDDYTRSRVLALAAYEGQQCPNCGNYMTLVDLPANLLHVRWAEHDNRKFAVGQYRCLACASADTVKRSWSERHGDEKPQPGQAAAGDGLMFMARPIDDEEV